MGEDGSWKGSKGGGMDDGVGSDRGSAPMGQGAAGMCEGLDGRSIRSRDIEAQLSALIHIMGSQRGLRPHMGKESPAWVGFIGLPQGFGISSRTQDG